jgi:hypothetical protein
VDPSKCQVFGPGVEGGAVGQPGKFTVKTANRFGTPIAEGGAPLHLKVQGPIEGSNPRVQKLVDNKDGTFSGEYVPVLHGDHTVTVDLAGIRFPLFCFETTSFENNFLRCRSQCCQLPDHGADQARSQRRRSEQDVGRAAQ